MKDIMALDTVNNQTAHHLVTKKNSIIELARFAFAVMIMFSEQNIYFRFRKNVLDRIMVF